MKRGFVERAKQTLSQPSRPPQQPSSSMDNASVEETSFSTKLESLPSSVKVSSSSPSQKIPRFHKPIKHEEKEILGGDAMKDQETKTAVSPPSPRNHKKLSTGEIDQLQRRPSMITNSRKRGSKASNNDADCEDHEEDEPEDNSSAFYLKHQNSALATELRSLQHAVNSLTEERDARRQQCHNSIQALHSLQATWNAMETALRQYRPDGSPSKVPSRLEKNASTAESPRIPSSTGTDSAIEWTRALHDALENLGKVATTNGRHAMEEINGISAGPSKIQRKRKLCSLDDDSLNEEEVNLEKSAVGELHIASNIAARATVLQETIWNLLSTSNGCVDDTSLKIAELEKENTLLESQAQTLESQISELASARRDMSARERRIRRNVYRLKAGMLTSEQVIKTLESDEDIAAEVELEKQQKIKLEQLQQQNDRLSKLTTEQVVNSNKHENGTDFALSQDQADALKRQVADLEDEVATLKNAVIDLSGILKVKEEQISRLSLKQISDVDAEKLQHIDSTSTKLKQATNRADELESKISETRNNWSMSLGNEKAALTAIEEMLSKFNKRWSELAGTEYIEQKSISDESPDENQRGLSDKVVLQSKEIIELNHKLEQALENVRQAESTRSNLKEALSMNGSLKSKLDEIKGKYDVVQASRANASNASVRPVQSSSSNPDSTLATSREKPAEQSSAYTPREKDVLSNNPNAEKDGGSSSKTEKLQRAYNRARKELASMTAAKAKLERAEKERESLLESNARLLRQISEKDEANARSLSTILYLKGQTDILSLEKSNLENQAKTAGQLVLAARLATNAKERVTEEVLKEKQSLEEKILDLEKKENESSLEIDRITLQLAVVQGKMSTENSELSNALKRIEDLIAENREQRERAVDLETAFQKAKRECREAKGKLVSHMKNSGNNKTDTPSQNTGINAGSNATGSFSVEQLNTQISMLKSRLACPVCHYRDKECIIMRCRHMHCQQCVDDQISNRSRKCPTCNVKFSEKDVEDIWLNT